MANEPERPIERLLRASAKKRRDEAGAPLELHPATRRLLQGEVVRKHAKAGRESRSFFQGLGQLWPRFTWGLALLAVMVVGVYMLLPVPGKGKPPTLLTRNEPTPPAERAKGPLPPSPAASAARANPSVVESADRPPPARRSPAPQIAGGPQPLSKDSSVAQTDVKVREKLALAVAPPSANRNMAAEAKGAAASGTPAPAAVVTANGAFARPSKSLGQPASVASAPVAPAAPSPAAKTPAEAGVVAADESAKLAVDRAGQSGFAYKSSPAGASAGTRTPSAAPTDGLLASAAAVRQEARSVSATQWFAQVAQGPKTKASQADKAMPAHPVLASFQLEQTGRELRVIDGDGSVYSGYLQIAAAARPQRSARTEAAAAPRPSRALEGVLENEAAARLDSDQPAPQTCFFRVTGTNRSLQKRVVFTGNLLAATNLTLSPPGSVIAGTASSVSGFRPASAQPNLLRLGNSRISGKVVIGSGKAVELDALPTSP